MRERVCVCVCVCVKQAKNHDSEFHMPDLQVSLYRHVRCPLNSIE